MSGIHFAQMKIRTTFSTRDWSSLAVIYNKLMYGCETFPNNFYNERSNIFYSAVKMIVIATDSTRLLMAVCSLSRDTPDPSQSKKDSRETVTCF